jgi:hypothetical protein
MFSTNSTYNKGDNSLSKQISTNNNFILNWLKNNSCGKVLFLINKLMKNGIYITTRSESDRF